MSQRPNEVPPVDHKDRRIAQAVIRDPRMSVEAIAAQIGEPVSTVQKHLAELLRTSCLERMIRVVDWAAVGYPLRYRIDLTTDQRQLAAGLGGPPGEAVRIDSQKKLATHLMRNLPKRFRDSLIVQDITVLFGDPDLCITVRAKSHQVVYDFVTGWLRLLGGIESTTTLHEVWSCADGDLVD